MNPRSNRRKGEEELTGDGGEVRGDVDRGAGRSSGAQFSSLRRRAAASRCEEECSVRSGELGVPGGEEDGVGKKSQGTPRPYLWTRR